MELVRGLYNLRARHRGCVLTIGAFDGIHRGHQEMIRLVREQAGRAGVPSALMSFEPMPREFFAKDDPPARLTRFREKVDALRSYGIERFICARFDEQLRSMEPERFVQQVLVAGLGVRHLVVGHDFKFGRSLRGNVDTLHAIGPRCGFDVTEVPAFKLEGERVSSSQVRAALGKGDLAHAAELLGRPYRMTGKVVHGGKLGRSLGFATANLRLHRRVTPLAGVFAVRASGDGLNGAPAVASLGTRPTIDGRELLLEVHVFDFDGELYRRYLHVDFIARLREERRFPTLQALAEQMREDAAQARRILEAVSG
jgi:riboflavin kinase/FMN adenylyltransferase